MESRTSTSHYWLWFGVWFVIIMLMLADVGGGSRQWFWMALPGVVTYFSKAMRLF